MAATVFAGAAQPIDAKNGPQGLFRLSPDGAAWERLTDGLPGPLEVRCIVLRAQGPRTIYIGTQHGPFRSTDGGDTWAALTLPSENNVTWTIVAHPSDPAILYAGAQDLGIFRTENGGKSWDALAVPEPAGLCDMGFPSRVIRMTMDPSNPDELYAGIEVGGLVRSLDGGETWQDCGGDLLRLAAQDHLKSRILSDTDTEGMMDSHALAISTALPGTVFLANRMGLFRSDDKAETWIEMGIGRHSPLTYARDIQVSRYDPRTLYAALSIAADSEAGSIYRSQDLGNSWDRFDHDVSVDSTMMTIGQSPSGPERLYGGARRGQVIGTEDGGASWRSLPLPEGVRGVFAVACD